MRKYRRFFTRGIGSTYGYGSSSYGSFDDGVEPQSKSKSKKWLWFAAIAAGVGFLLWKK